MPKQLFIECDAKEGMFSDEAVAFIGGEPFVVPRRAIRGGIGQNSKLAVRSVKRGDQTFIVIPTEYTDVLPKRSEMVLVEE